MSEETPERETLAGQLQKWRTDMGWPSVREIAALAHCSHTTVADILGGRRPGSLAITMAITKALKGDTARARQLWATEDDSQIQKQALESSSQDGEARAIEKAALALSTLDTAAQRRVLAYLTARFGGHGE